MATYLPDRLKEMWEHSKLTVEMAVGHIIQRMVNHEERLRRLERLMQLPPDSAPDA